MSQDNIEFLKAHAELEELKAETVRKDRASIVKAIEACRDCLTAKVVADGRTPGSDQEERPVLEKQDEYHVRDKMLKLIQKL